MRTLSWTSLVIDNKTHTCFSSAEPLNRSTLRQPVALLPLLTPYQTWENCSWKNASNIVTKDTTKHEEFRSLKPFFIYIFHHVCYFSQGCFEPIRLNGFVVVVVVDRILAEQCRKPLALPSATDMSAMLLFLFGCKLFKKAISVRIESPFVIGLPYSTVI